MEPAFCILGAGSSGLAVVKNFAAAGLPIVCYEAQHDLGGNWLYDSPASSAYRSVSLISSKRLTEYTDFPMPEDWPEFISGAQAGQYLQDYAARFDLRRHIHFNTPVISAAPENGGWRVTLPGGQSRLFRGLVVANGHNWDPRWPDYPGHFSGTVLHSSQYKTPDALVGKRVLVVGAGNSGCDIAVEAATVATRVVHSTRRGYHYIPKFLRGKPSDQCAERLLRWRVPLWLRRRLISLVVHSAVGRPEQFGLPRPDHRFYETHPIINSQLLYAVGHGRVTPRGDIARLDDRRVEFADGASEEFDVIVYATGFRTSFPFLDDQCLPWRDGRPDLYLNIFSRQYDNLFFAGLIQPDSGQWGLVDWQARLMVADLQAREARPKRAAWFQAKKLSGERRHSRGLRYVNTPRHALEVEHFSYRRELERLVAKLAS